ncbi:MAG: NAD(P)-binding domain-containing protein [Anaerolineales bacterium]|jgi:predicted dinucleotide-binding enzyme
MNIAILGAGRIGGTLGKKWAKAGHVIKFGVRNPNKSEVQELIKGLKGQAAATNLAEAIASGEVVVFAIPGAAMDETISTHAAALDGKIVIDAANKMGTAVANSQATFSVQTPNAQVYRAFNNLGWENFEDPLYNGIPADLFYSGPEGQARPKVEKLISEVGLRPIYVGGPEQAGLVDDLLALWFTLVSSRNMGRGIAFKLLQRN